MDIFQSVQGYISKMVSQGDSTAAAGGAAKMKILLLDKDTVCLPQQHMFILISRSIV